MLKKEPQDIEQDLLLAKQHLLFSPLLSLSKTVLFLGLTGRISFWNSQNNSDFEPKF